jgi:radical SAM superfamily enzyme YgiQ (UPF0313 family)
MHDFDVLVVGGYALKEKSGGGEDMRRKIQLRVNQTPAGIDFLRTLVQENGDLSKASAGYARANSSKLVSRSLNTIYLYDYLSKNGISAAVVNYFLLEQDKFRDLMSLKPKAVVISTTFMHEVNDIISIAKAAKAIYPETTVIAGGIKIFKSYRAFKLHHEGYFEGFDTAQMMQDDFFFSNDIDKNIDVFVIEECGEVTLLELLRRVTKRRPWKDLPNLGYRENGELMFGQRSPEPFTFEKSPISWQKIPEEMLGTEIPIKAGMGCPHRCAFCDFAGLHKVRMRPIASIVEELRCVQRAFPGKPIFFTDDNLFATKQRARELTRAIIESGLHFNWRAFFRVDAISEDTAPLLAQSGCSGCLLGVESGDPQILKNMNKKATRQQTLRAVELLNQNGIHTLSTLIVGFPGETKETVDSSIDLLNSYPDHDGTINQYIPFTFMFWPLTPAASLHFRKTHGISGGYDNWAHWTMNSDEAREHLYRLFLESHGPTYQYPENMPRDIPIEKLKKAFKERDALVKSGVCSIGESNAGHIADIFRPILE